MKQILVTIILSAVSAVASAQTICQNLGNGMTTCNGPGGSSMMCQNLGNGMLTCNGPNGLSMMCQNLGNGMTSCNGTPGSIGGATISALPTPPTMQQLQLEQAEAQRAQAEAQLAQAQANAIRQQQAEEAQDRFKSEVSQASTENLQEALDTLESRTCHWWQGSACQDQLDWQTGVINDELQRRSSESSPNDVVSGSETDPSAGDASSSSDAAGGSTETDLSPDEACRKLDALNKGYSAGTVTQQQFDAQFQGLMKACDGTH